MSLLWERWVISSRLVGSLKINKCILCNYSYSTVSCLEIVSNFYFYAFFSVSEVQNIGEPLSLATSVFFKSFFFSATSVF
jgi:hypothetical protein